jgi:hypothetical protein
MRSQPVTRTPLWLFLAPPYWLPKTSLSPAVSALGDIWRSTSWRM